MGGAELSVKTSVKTYFKIQKQKSRQTQHNIFPIQKSELKNK